MQVPQRDNQSSMVAEQGPKFVSIDQSWISEALQMKPELLVCPICYIVPLDYPYQCAKCERIFCKKDYDKIVQTDNKCPTCKTSPWIKKQKLHISYKNMFAALRFNCKFCTIQKEMNKEEVVEHLETHNMFLSEQSILYDYTFVSEDGVQLKLNLVQNLQINVRKSMEIAKFEIGGPAGKVLVANLKDMQADHPTLGKCKIIQSKSKMLKRNKQYMIWTVDIADKEVEVGGQRFVFYSEEFQGIIERNYQDFLNNQRLNQFCLDVRQTRFRISFWDMTQTNTFTKSEKPILRVPITLR